MASHRARRSTRLARVLLIPALATAVGCGSATLVMRDGSRVHGDIEGGDRYTLTLSDVEREVPRAGPGAGYETHLAGRAVVDRADIVDIDHPGNVLLVTGGCIAALGGILIAASMRDRPEEPAADEESYPYADGLAEDTMGIGGAIYGAIGVGLGVAGLVTWLGSTGAAEPSDGPDVAIGPGGFVISGRF